MKHRVSRAFFNFEKEEIWLNNMAAKGLNFIDYNFFRYLFEEGTPGQYTYRIELLEKLPSHPESQAYIKFMEEAGVECVGSYLRWVYFRKKKADGPFDLYSDYDSRIKHYKRVAAFAIWGLLLNLFVGIYNLALGLYLGHEGGFYINAYISIVSWLVVVSLIPLYINLKRKIRRLKNEKQLYE
jgi:hypothetical protein